MTQEDYVSFDVAQILKGKGYDEPCFRVFTPGSKGKYRLSRRYPAETNADICSLKEGFTFDEYLAPSLAQAAKWLREKHGIIVDIDTDYYDGFIFTYQAWTLGEISDKESFDTYEQALNEGIKEALKMI